MGLLSCYWQWISSSDNIVKVACRSTRLSPRGTSRIHSYFGNVLTKFMANTRTDAWKTRVSLLSSVFQIASPMILSPVKQILATAVRFGLEGPLEAIFRPPFRISLLNNKTVRIFKSRSKFILGSVVRCINIFAAICAWMTDGLASICSRVSVQNRKKPRTLT